MEFILKTSIIDELREVMKRMKDPLKYGFYCVDYVYQGKDKVAVHFDMISAQQAMMSMLKRGVECKGMREWKPNE